MGDGITDRVIDGLSVQRQSLFITNIAGTVYCEIEAIGGGDITYRFGGADYLLDCTTGGGIGGRARSEALTSGTDEAPVQNNCYVIPGPDLTAILTNSVEHPNGTTFGWVAEVTLQSAAETLADGPLFLRRTTDAVSFSGRGMDSRQNERIRIDGARWGRSGGSSSVIIDAAPSPDAVYFDITSAIVYQLHRQLTDALSITNGSPAHVLNDSVTPFLEIEDLGDLLTDASGGSMSGRYYALRIYLTAASGDDGVDRLYISLPEGSYLSSDGAVNDSSGFDVNSVPVGIFGGSINVARIVLRHQAAAGGTFTLIDLQSTLGISVNSAGGAGGTAQSQTFPTSTFRVYVPDFYL